MIELEGKCSQTGMGKSNIQCKISQGIMRSEAQSDVGGWKVVTGSETGDRPKHLK